MGGGTYCPGPSCKYVPFGLSGGGSLHLGHPMVSSPLPMGANRQSPSVIISAIGNGLGRCVSMAAICERSSLTAALSAAVISFSISSGVPPPPPVSTCVASNCSPGVRSASGLKTAR